MSISLSNRLNWSRPCYLREAWESGDLRPTFSHSLYMVIRAYIDESYSEPRTFALGCVLARGMDWFDINKQWNRVLDRKNKELVRAGRPTLSRYHSSDCNNLQGEFKGWTPAERSQFLSELIGVLSKSKAKHKAHIVGNTVDLRDVGENFPTRESNPRPVAYGLLSIVLWKEIAEQARRIYPNPEIYVEYERGPFNGIITASFNALHDSEFPDRLLFRKCAQNVPPFVPLQVADLVAYETMKETDRRETGRDRRQSFAALLDGTPGRGTHIPARTLLRLAEGYWAKKLPEMLNEAAYNAD